MFKSTTIIFALATAAFAAEISNSYALLEKTSAFNPDLRTEETHAVHKKDNKPETEHPVYKNEARANVKPVRPMGPVIKHDMLADQPLATEVSRVDNLQIPGYGFVAGPAEVAYPDIPYAPGYGYDSAYGPNGYDVYGPNSYALEPDTSFSSLLWSQVPDSRTIVSYMGKTIVWVVNSIIVLIVGSLLTVGLCSYTNLCAITFNGVGPIHEEMRSLVTPERLEKLSTAAGFVKNAIDKYQKIQQVTDGTTKRKRRAFFY